MEDKKDIYDLNPDIEKLYAGEIDKSLSKEIKFAFLKEDIKNVLILEAVYNSCTKEDRDILGLRSKFEGDVFWTKVILAKNLGLEAEEGKTNFKTAKNLENAFDEYLSDFKKDLNLNYNNCSLKQKYYVIEPALKKLSQKYTFVWSYKHFKRTIYRNRYLIFPEAMEK